MSAETHICTGHYGQSCGQAFCTLEGDRKANGMKFCPYCGGEIADVASALAAHTLDEEDEE
jgi:uncharacterized membrane protein YvbJ